MRPVLFGAFMIVLVFGLTISAGAQTTTGALVGDVTDSSGARLPGVAIKVVSQQTGAARDTITNELGSYRFNGLMPADYSVTAELSGFKTIARKNVNVAISSTSTLNFTMEVASLTDTIQVTEQAPLVETKEHTVQTLIDTKHIQELPLKSRNFMDLALLSPGVVMDQSAAAGGQVTPISFGALDARYKSIWLEGVDFNDEVTSGGSTLSDPTRIQLAQEAIQEFQVMATGYSTEFGRSAGGVINIVSKSGGNNFHGNVFYFRRSDKFAKSPFQVTNGVAAPLSPEPLFKIQQLGGTAGGPIKKDKAHFFFSYERQLSDRTVSVNIPDAIKTFVKNLGYDTRTEVPVDTKVNNYVGKLTFALHPSHTLNLSYLYDDRRLPNQQVSSSSAADHGYNDVRAAYFLVGNLTSLLGSKTVNELRFSRSIQKLNRIVPGNNLPQLTFPAVSFGQASNIPQSRQQYNWVFVDTASRHFTGFFGEHDLKFGAQANKVYAVGRINNSFNGAYTFQRDLPVTSADSAPGACQPYSATTCSLPYLFSQGIDLRNNNALIERSVNIYYAFINDSWRITPRFTMNLGLRWDHIQWAGDLKGTPYPSGVSAFDLYKRMIVGDLRGINFVTMPEQHNWSPRVGFSWDARGNGHTVVRAGFGYYYDRVNTTTLRGVIDGYNGFTTSAIANDSRNTAAANNFFPRLPSQSQFSAGGVSATASFNVPNPAGKFPYTQQSNIGVQHQFAANWAFAVDYNRTFGQHFQQSRNVNAPTNAPCGTTGLPACIYPVNPSQRMILLDNSGVVKINQFQSRLQGRLNKLTLNVGYTLADAKGDANTPVDAYSMHDFGALPNDVRHRLTSNAIYDLPFKIQLGGIVTFNTAAPYNIVLGNVANNNDRANTVRPAGTPFNSGRGDDYFTLDLRTSKNFVFKDTKRVEILWEMFNVFNTQNLISYQGNLGASNPRLPRAALDAFQGQLGLKFSF